MAGKVRWDGRAQNLAATTVRTGWSPEGGELIAAGPGEQSFRDTGAFALSLQGRSRNRNSLGRWWVQYGRSGRGRGKAEKPGGRPE